jgi:hypothetical protein
MRTECPTGDFDPRKVELFRTADWKRNPLDTLTQVDELLAGYGLEVVLVDMWSDEHVFRIVPRLPAPQHGGDAKP